MGEIQLGVCRSRVAFTGMRAGLCGEEEGVV